MLVLPSAHGRVNLGFYAAPGTRISCPASCNDSGVAGSAEHILRFGGGLRQIPYIGAIDVVPCYLGSGRSLDNPLIVRAEQRQARDELAAEVSLCP